MKRKLKYIKNFYIKKKRKRYVHVYFCYVIDYTIIYLQVITFMY